MKHFYNYQRSLREMEDRDEDLNNFKRDTRSREGLTVLIPTSIKFLRRLVISIRYEVILGRRYFGTILRPRARVK